jgi:hypothetical protein
VAVNMTCTTKYRKARLEPAEGVVAGWEVELADRVAIAIIQGDADIQWNVVCYTIY